MSEIAKLPAAELVNRYRRKTLSPVEVTKAALARIEQCNGAVNAFCVIDADQALAGAAASEARWVKGEPCGLVDGVPTTIKDVVLTRGWPTLRGSRTTDPDQPWEVDAPCTARLREHGAVLLGKTTTPEFGWKGVTDNLVSGITRNPWNTDRTPGGSSGGAAAAAALGMGALHIGTDGGGSIRIPSGFTGVFGHKPSFGRVPAWPGSAFGTLSHVGPLTRTVGDAALMLNVISEPDARDWTALPYSARDYRVGLEDGVAGLRIAFSPTLGYIDVDPEIAALVRAAAKVMRDLGATVEEIDPGFNDPAETFRRHWFGAAGKMVDGFPAEKQELLDPGLREVAAMGSTLTFSEFLDAVEARNQLGETMSQFHETYDLLLTPTMPIPAFKAGQEVPDPDNQPRWTVWTPFTFPFNLTQQPVSSAPCGFTSDGLPAGMQIIGPKHADALVLRAARAYESACPFRMPNEPNVQHQ
ncbi:MAG: amidase [Alphaproteobacteria bacterium]|nr:amidase [Alphaproteobacteria bacterium]